MYDIEKKSKKQMIQVLLSTFIGNLGSGILIFIIGLLILKQTNSALSFGISQVIGPLVALILVPLTGSIIDRFSKKLIIFLAQLLSIVGLIIYSVILYHQGFENLIYTYLLLVVLKISDQFLTTAFTASVVSVVLDKHVQKIRSFQQLLGALLTIISPIAAVLLLAVISLNKLVILEVILELLVLIILWGIDFNFTKQVIDNKENRDASKNIFLMFQDGLKFIYKSNKLIFALFFSMLINFSFGAITVGLPYIQIQILHFSNNIFGITEAIFSVGMLLSAVILSVAKNIDTPLFHSWKMINKLGILFVIFGIILFFPLSKISYIIVIGIFNFLLGTLITRINVPVTIWLTKEIPQQMQGRVFNLLNTGVQFLTPIGILIFSGLFDIFNSYIIFITAGIAILLIAVLFPLIYKVNLKENNI